MVLPEAEEFDVDLDMQDVRIERTTSTGPGGQSVNTTYSAIKLHHEPTGIIVSCQDQKSQHKNLEKALKVTDAEIIKNNGLLNNKTFMFTGKLLNMSRSEAKSIVEQNSGSIVSNVNKKLDFKSDFGPCWDPSWGEVGSKTHLEIRPKKWINKKCIKKC